jgi:hypothetical protein
VDAALPRAGKIGETVPGVWPGVWLSVTVVPPSVSFWPSAMSRSPVGALAGDVEATRSQSAGAIMTRVPYWSARYWAPPKWSPWPWVTTTYLIVDGSAPRLRNPETMYCSASSGVLRASMRMMPRGVRIAVADTKPTLSTATLSKIRSGAGAGGLGGV